MLKSTVIRSDSKFDSGVKMIAGKWQFNIERKSTGWFGYRT